MAIGNSGLVFSIGLVFEKNYLIFGTIKESTVNANQKKDMIVFLNQRSGAGGFKARVLQIWIRLCT